MQRAWFDMYIFFRKVHWDRVLMVEISCRVVEDKIELQKKKSQIIDTLKNRSIEVSLN